jgi:hypothetical protein
MSHKDWLNSVRNNDGRKWLIEEREGQSYYIEIAEQPKLSTGETKKVERARRNKRKLVKTTAKAGKPYSCRLSYNICTSQYTGGNDVPMLSGSSFNRKKQEPKPAKKSVENAVHVMSKRSKGRIRDKSTALYRASKERTFVTLTFIEHVGDRRSKSILNKFLTVVRKEVKGFEYLVVAEHQPERDTKTIHFHMVCNRRLNVRRFNPLWVLQQYNAGLTGHRANGEAIAMNEIAARYNDGTIGDVLNPFQIEKAYGISSLSNYLTKYVTKQEDGEKFDCLTWHCSRKVSRLFTKQLVGASTFAFLKSFRNYKVDRQTGEMWAPAELHGNFYSCIFVNNKPNILARLEMMEAVNRWIIDKYEPDRTLKDALEKHQRVWIGKENNFDPFGVVGEIIAKNKTFKNEKENVKRYN